MSHIVTVETRVHDAVAVTHACRRLGLAAPTTGKAELFNGSAEGMIVHLPGWQYPAVIDLLSGSVRYDNYGGTWGSESELHRFFQMYTVEKARLEAQRRGHPVQEQTLPDGSIQLRILEGAA